MPQFYVSVEQDYVTLSNEAALAYATNTGRFWIHGKDALDLLNRISTQQLADVKKMKFPSRFKLLIREELSTF